MVKCLNIGKNIGKPIYRSISNQHYLINSLFFFITTDYISDWPHSHFPEELDTVSTLKTNQKSQTFLKGYYINKYIFIVLIIL